ncbi:hypothetical protein CYY_004762 [Polysphondylium violaceum]|uniref:Major facilitator superfamily (MFS) profile domain-containing protein n=1 Tax=Polysphondylium violaceum TaxID=133409 RepID=A0A8J4PSV7_9MYCE|nr:hypothetical protein CYY_004762 [Polysphondylium violaceum]
MSTKSYHQVDDDENEKVIVVTTADNSNNIDSSNSEQDEAKKRVAKSINIMVLTVFLQSIGFTVMMPSMYDYLEWIRPSFGDYNGWVVAVYSAGQFLSSPFFGYWSNKRDAREPLIVSIIISIVGNILYAIVYKFNGKAVIIMAIARFIVGIGAGNVSVCRAFASEVSDISSKTTTMAKMGAAQGAGFVLGPAIGYALAYCNFHIKDLVINEYTAPGYLSVLFAFANITAILIAFKDTRDIKSRLEKEKIDIETAKANSNSTGVKRPWYYQKNQKLLPIFVSIFLFAIVISIFAVFETILTELTKRYYNWEVKQNGYILGGTGILSIVVFVVISLPFIKKFDDRKMVIFGFANLTVALLFLANYGKPFNWETDLPLWQFIIGSVFVSIGYPIASSLIYAIFSKVLNPTSQGTKMGWLTAGGSLARMLGPIWAQSIWNKCNQEGMVLFLVTASISVVAIITLIVFFRKLDPHPDYKPPTPPPPKTTSINADEYDESKPLLN